MAQDSGDQGLFMIKHVRKGKKAMGSSDGKHAATLPFSWQINCVWI